MGLYIRSRILDCTGEQCFILVSHKKMIYPFLHAIAKLKEFKHPLYISKVILCSIVYLYMCAIYSLVFMDC